MTGNQDLERAILDAHANGKGDRLAVLYGEAGQAVESQGQIDRACFFYTQAYIFALDAGADTLARELKQKLVAYGREE